VLDFLKALFKPAPSSGETAKERLRLVLLSDHLSLAPDVIESLKRDLLAVISRYVEFDSANADVSFEQREREVAMLASVPITAVRERPKPSPDLLFSLEPSSWPVRENGAEPVSGQLLGSDELAAESAPEPAPEREPEMAAESRAEEAPLELAVATVPKPKPARSGNAAGTRRRRRKKYAAATNAAKAKHPHPQQLGGQASAQA